MEQREMRSPLGRAIGLGSAKEGVEHWWRQRLTALALVPLGLWFVTSILAHIGADYEETLAWLGTPIPAILMILLIGATFYHAALGIQVVIEDYIHQEWVKLGLLVAVRFGCFLLAVAGIFAILRIALGG
jgi:succinate dehydrogenase / fumarate reductase, membrane anchor subunit